MIINDLWEGHKITYIMVSLSIYIKDNTIRQLLLNEVISIDYIKSKNNLVNSLIKGLLEDQII